MRQGRGGRPGRRGVRQRAVAVSAAAVASGAGADCSSAAIRIRIRRRRASAVSRRQRELRARFDRRVDRRPGDLQRRVRVKRDARRQGRAADQGLPVGSRALGGAGGRGARDDERSEGEGSSGGDDDGGREPAQVEQGRVGGVGGAQRDAPPGVDDDRGPVLGVEEDGDAGLIFFSFFLIGK